MGTTHAKTEVSDEIFRDKSLVVVNRKKTFGTAIGRGRSTIRGLHNYTDQLVAELVVIYGAVIVHASLHPSF